MSDEHAAIVGTIRVVAVHPARQQAVALEEVGQEHHAGLGQQQQIAVAWIAARDMHPPAIGVGQQARALRLPQDLGQHRACACAVRPDTDHRRVDERGVVDPAFQRQVVQHAQDVDASGHRHHPVIAEEQEIDRVEAAPEGLHEPLDEAVGFDDAVARLCGGRPEGVTARVQRLKVDVPEAHVVGRTPQRLGHDAAVGTVGQRVGPRP
jgi:hypothetical protein